MNHEPEARAIHRTGTNCSTAVYRAFSDVDKAGGTPPAPRSIAGKCGALLTAQQVLKDMGVDAADELERDFCERLGFVTCIDLKRARRDCNDCVGVAAELADKYLAQA